MERKMTETNPESAHVLFSEYFNSGDFDSLLGMYEDNAAFVAGPDQVVTGKDAIREPLQALLSLKGTMEMTTRYAIRTGDLALLSSEWHLKGTGPDGAPVELSGKTAEIVRLQPDGSWLFVADHPFGAY
jgi:ketosteroid isomerase-like protein